MAPTRSMSRTRRRLPSTSSLQHNQITSSPSPVSTNNNDNMTHNNTTTSSTIRTTSLNNNNNDNNNHKIRYLTSPGCMSTCHFLTKWTITSISIAFAIILLQIALILNYYELFGTTDFFFNIFLPGVVLDSSFAGEPNPQSIRTHSGTTIILTFMLLNISLIVLYFPAYLCIPHQSPISFFNLPPIPLDSTNNINKQLSSSRITPSPTIPHSEDISSTIIINPLSFPEHQSSQPSPISPLKISTSTHLPNVNEELEQLSKLFPESSHSTPIKQLSPLKPSRSPVSTYSQPKNHFNRIIDDAAFQLTDTNNDFEDEEDECDISNIDDEIQPILKRGLEYNIEAIAQKYQQQNSSLQHIIPQSQDSHPSQLNSINNNNDDNNNDTHIISRGINNSPSTSPSAILTQSNNNSSSPLFTTFLLTLALPGTFILQLCSSLFSFFNGSSNSNQSSSQPHSPTTTSTITICFKSTLYFILFSITASLFLHYSSLNSFFHDFKVLKFVYLFHILFSKQMIFPFHPQSFTTSSTSYYDSTMLLIYLIHLSLIILLIELIQFLLHRSNKANVANSFRTISYIFIFSSLSLLFIVVPFFQTQTQSSSSSSSSFQSLTIATILHLPVIIISTSWAIYAIIFTTIIFIVSFVPIIVSIFQPKSHSNQPPPSTSEQISIFPTTMAQLHEFKTHFMRYINTCTWFIYITILLCLLSIMIYTSNDTLQNYNRFILTKSSQTNHYHYQTIVQPSSQLITQRESFVINTIPFESQQFRFIWLIFGFTIFFNIMISIFFQHNTNSHKPTLISPGTELSTPIPQTIPFLLTTICQWFIEAIYISHIQPIIHIFLPLLILLPHSIIISPLQNFSTIALIGDNNDSTNFFFNLHSTSSPLAVQQAFLFSAFSILAQFIQRYNIHQQQTSINFSQLFLVYFVYILSHSLSLTMCYFIITLCTGMWSSKLLK